MREAQSLHLDCRGVVQGVGFRPLVHRLALELGLAGDASNGVGLVRLRLHGPRPALEQLLQRLPQELPPPGRLEPLQPQWRPAPPQALAQRPGVRIQADPPQPLQHRLWAPALSPDRAPCAACRQELADPANRRYRDPFISCCGCGPRLSIATAEPYCRAHTTLAAFVPCALCQQEFHDPGNRRFHAETIGCPACGPQLQLLDPFGAPLADPEAPEAALAEAVALLQAGGVLALQGVGGFQLLVDAANPNAVALLRRRKRRPRKPLAVLVADARQLEPWLQMSTAERQVLEDPAAPIVLLRWRPERADAGEVEPWVGVAPASPGLGVMLPASGLHLLLAQAFAGPLVATSCNRSGETLCTSPREALQRLGGAATQRIADGLLVHNRPIARPLDDSVLQLIDGRPSLLRRARGYGPQVHTGALAPGPVLALGGDLRCAPALLDQGDLWLAPHLGDLADPQALARLEAGMAAQGTLEPGRTLTLVADGHPGYLGHQLAQRATQVSGVRLQLVQHHRAHGLAVVAEHNLPLPVLALCLDGLGLGDASGADDPLARQRLWGGELLRLGASSQRLAALYPFVAPGADRAQRQPWRSALGLLAALEEKPPPGTSAAEDSLASWLGHGDLTAWRAQLPPGWELVLPLLARESPALRCSSAGRLIDGVAALLGFGAEASHDAETGLWLQAHAARATGQALPLPRNACSLPLSPGPLPLGWIDWRPLLIALLEARSRGAPLEVLAAQLHNSLAQGLAAACGLAAAREGLSTVVLAGGCFQNRLLLETTLAALRARGLEPFWGQAVPVNDGGLAVGQALAAGLTPP